MARYGALIWLALLAAGLVPARAVAQAPAAGQASAPEPSVVAAGVEDPLAGLRRPGDAVTLSDEASTTRWAHTQETSVIRGAPLSNAGKMGRLRFLTEDGLAEVYLVLDARMDGKRRRWLHIRIPKRPNGRTGWVLESALSQLYVVRTQLVIDRSDLHATLYRKGAQIWRARVAIGRSATPTPSGRFWIRERLKGLGDGTTYGPWAFGTSAYSNLSDWPGGGVVGIHGTNRPELIPGRPSHGCVRVRNDKIRELARLMPVGTPVQVIR